MTKHLSPSDQHSLLVSSRLTIGRFAAACDMAVYINNKLYNSTNTYTGLVWFYNSIAQARAYVAFSFFASFAEMAGIAYASFSYMRTADVHALS